MCMLELLFEFVLELLCFRWIYGDGGDDRRPWWVYLICLLILIAITGGLWWLVAR